MVWTGVKTCPRHTIAMRKVKARYRKDRDCWYVRVPTILCPDGDKRSQARKECYPTKAQAEARAREINKLIKSHGEQIKIPSAKELLRLQRINNKIGDRDADEVLKVGISGVENRTKSKLIEDFMSDIWTIKKSPTQNYSASYPEMLNLHLRKLRDTHGNIHLSDFDRFLIEEHIESYTDNPNYRYNIKRFLSAAFEKAREMNFVQENPVKKTKRYNKDEIEVDIYDINQAKNLLNGSSPSMYVTHLFGLASGLRPSEVRRCKFQYLYLNKKKPCFILPKEVCKGSNSGKIVYLSENWIEFLRPFDGLEGYVAPYPETSKIRASGASVIKSQYMKWYNQHWVKDVYNANRIGGSFEDTIIFDGHRHTFGSMTYWFQRETDRAKEGALAYTKSQLGHYASSDVAIKHYIDLNKRIHDIGDMSREYFSIFPSDIPDNGYTSEYALEYCHEKSGVA